MLIIGRITKDAVVSQLKDEREVVNFSVAINDYYKSKGNEQGVKVITYVNCSYWISSKIASRQTKGTFVELFGRLSSSAYNDAKGEAKASQNFHVNNIKIHQSGGTQVSVDSEGKLQPAEAALEITDALDYLPF
jgi:single-strand DNA-binding protein